MSRSVVPVGSLRTVRVSAEHRYMVDEDTGEQLLDEDTGEPLRWWSGYLHPRRIKEVPMGSVAHTTGETGREFPFQLTDSDGSTPDLSGAAVVAHLAKPRDAASKIDVTSVVGEPDGIVVLTVPPDVEAAVWQVEFTVNGAGFVDATFPDRSQDLPKITVRSPLGGA